MAKLADPRDFHVRVHHRLHKCIHHTTNDEQHSAKYQKILRMPTNLVSINDAMARIVIAKQTQHDDDVRDDVFMQIRIAPLF